MRAASLDPVATWFDALQRRGDPTDILVGFQKEAGCAPQWTSLPHHRYDGASALMEALRSRDYQPEALPLQKGLDFQTLRPFAVFQRLAMQAVVSSDSWLQQGPASEDGADRRLVWALLSQDETQQVEAQCRHRSLSVTAHLLTSLQRALAPWQSSGFGRSLWMLPVNLRGVVDLGDEAANHISFLRMEVALGDRARDVHDRVRRAVESGEHWANWKALWLGSALGTNLTQQVIAWQERSPAPLVGVYSHLGSWSPSRPQLEIDDGWFAVQPVVRFCPVGVGSLIWHGRLSVAMRVHPHLGVSQHLAEEWLARFLVELKSGFDTPYFRVRS